MRRGSLEIQMDILQAIQEHPGIILTHIMYKANVSQAILNGYLKPLLARNFIECRKQLKKHTNAKGGYWITDQGRQMLAAYKIVSNFMENRTCQKSIYNAQNAEAATCSLPKTQKNTSVCFVSTDGSNINKPHRR